MKQFLKCFYFASLMPLFSQAMEQQKSSALSLNQTGKSLEASVKALHQPSTLMILSSKALLKDAIEKRTCLESFFKRLPQELCWKLLFICAHPTYNPTFAQKIEIISCLYGLFGKDFTIFERMRLLLEVVRTPVLRKERKITFLRQYVDQVSSLIKKELLSEKIKHEYEAEELPIINQFIELLSQENIQNIEKNDVIHFLYENKCEVHNTIDYLFLRPTHSAACKGDKKLSSYGVNISILTYALYWQNHLLIRILQLLKTPFNYYSVGLEDLNEPDAALQTKDSTGVHLLMDLSNSIMLAIDTLNPVVLNAFLEGFLCDDKQNHSFPIECIPHAILRSTAREKSLDPRHRRYVDNKHHCTEVLDILFSHGCPIPCASKKNQTEQITILDMLAKDLRIVPDDVTTWLINHGVVLTPHGLRLFCQNAYFKIDQKAREAATIENYYPNTVMGQIIKSFGSIKALPAQFNDYKIYLAILFSDIAYAKELLTQVDWQRPLTIPYLHYAAYFGRTELVQLLIERYGCLLLEPDVNTALPLHKVCVAGHTEVVKYLVSLVAAGNDIGLNTIYRGSNPIDLARAYKHKEICAMLAQYDAQSTNPDATLSDYEDDADA